MAKIAVNEPSRTKEFLSSVAVDIADAFLAGHARLLSVKKANPEPSEASPDP